MKLRPCIAALAASASVLCAAAAQAAPAHPFRLPAPAALRGTFAGVIAPGEPITIYVTMQGRHLDEIDRLIEQQNSPSSPLYRRYLTPAQYGRYYGASASDYDQALAALRAGGFTIDLQSESRSGIVAHAPAAVVERFFGTPIDERVERGRRFFANRFAPEVPAALHASAVDGLDGYIRWHPHLAGHPLRVAPDAKIGRLAGWGAQDIESAYGLPAVYRKYDGSGVTVVDATVGLVQTGDFTSFNAKFGLHAKLTQIPLTYVPPLDDIGESTIDVEWMSAIAPASNVVLVTANGVENGDMLAMHAYIVDKLSNDHLVSTSWGFCEQQFIQAFGYYPSADEALFRQAQTQGQWWLSAAGDAGSDDCEVNRGPIAVDYPGSSPYVVSVGGTRVTPASISPGGAYAGWKSEVVWNDGAGGGAGGGGISTLFTRPKFQRAALPKAYMREVPDVALMADGEDPYGGYLSYFQGHWYGRNGGTSFAAPEWAAFLGLIQQRYGSNAIASPLTRLYALAATPAYAADFHDIVSGCNAFLGVPGYCAAKGYDAASGLGSFIGPALQAAY